VTRYVYRDGAWRNPSTDEPMEVPDRVAIPMVRSDIEPYQSVVSGKWITSASARRNDLAETGCVPYEPDTRKRPKGLSNPKFAKKHNAMHLLTEEARDKHKIAKRAVT
jgi:hypothetical protein